MLCDGGFDGWHDFGNGEMVVLMSSLVFLMDYSGGGLDRVQIW
jgi:hypothetical protein